MDAQKSERHNPRLPKFTERFVKLRVGTQDEFAKKLGITRPTVGLYESGARIPDAEILRRIAINCDVSADYLIGLSDCPSRDDDIQIAQKTTGLSFDALRRILDNEYSGRDEAIDALNHLLPGNNLFHMLSALSEYIAACQTVHDLNELRIKAITSSGEEYTPNQSLIDAVEKEINNMDLAELRAQKNFFYVLDEIRGRYLKNE